MTISALLAEHATNMVYKGERMLDDMHDMVSYVNELRVLFFIITSTAYLGGICFLYYKCSQRSLATPREQVPPVGYIPANDRYDEEKNTGNYASNLQMQNLPSNDEKKIPTEV